MKLLIVTQKVDKNDPILGFFHTWLLEFAKNFEKVTVICLEKGDFNLPQNVRVLSLGKEEGPSRLKYLLRFLRYIWQEKDNYDSVFVHMNQEYVLLAGDLWRLMGKKVYLWRNHAMGDWKTVLAGFLSHKVFYTSPQAYVAKFKNAIQMPAGIDLSLFRPAPMPVEAHKILVLGRVAPVKRLGLIIDALTELNKKTSGFEVHIAGSVAKEDEEYLKMLQSKIYNAELTKKVKMLPAVPHDKTAELYRHYKLFVNLTLRGSLDKTIFEALASGLKVVVSNPFFKEVLPSNWIAEEGESPRDLAARMQSVLIDSHSRNSETQGKISVLLEEHGFENLIQKLSSILSQ